MISHHWLCCHVSFQGWIVCHDVGKEIEVGGTGIDKVFGLYLFISIYKRMKKEDTTVQIFS